MILDAINALLATVSIIFSRLDRHHDAALAGQDLRSGLLQLDGLLEDWLVAAKVTNESFGRKSYAIHQLAIGQRVRGRLQSPLSAGADDSVNSDTASLRRLFEIYAPAESAHIAQWAKSRVDLVNLMLQDLYQSR
jgi:hypothetical protein